MGIARKRDIYGSYHLDLELALSAVSSGPRSIADNTNHKRQAPTATLLDHFNQPICLASPPCDITRTNGFEFCQIRQSSHVCSIISPVSRFLPKRHENHWTYAVARLYYPFHCQLMDSVYECLFLLLRNAMNVKIWSVMACSPESKIGHLIGATPQIGDRKLEGSIVPHTFLSKISLRQSLKIQ